MLPNPENEILTPQDIKRYNLLVWKYIGGCFAFIVLLIAVTALGLFGQLPSFRELENPKSNQASEIISSDKQILGTYYVENRSSVSYKSISSNVINALIATEDKRFKDHSGIDFSRSFSIFLLNIFGSRQGGSTITQQLAKNQFSKDKIAHSFFARLPQKLKELITAVRLERRYTKEEIITMYLNSVSFGSYNVFGIKTAARTYFNTTPDQLSPNQAALLVGMLNGTKLYSPIKNPEKALARRNLVLNRMKEAGFLSQGQAAEFKAKPLGLDFKPIDHNVGLATYFRDYLKRDIQKIFDDKSITDNGRPYDLDRDGLKIYTTINASMQQYAEEAQKEYMRTLQIQFNQHWKGISLWNTIKNEAGKLNFKSLLDQGMRRSDRYRELSDDGKTEKEIRADFNTPAKMSLFTWHGNIDTTMKPIDSIVYCKMLLRNSLMSMDPTTGYIKAWVGGINFEHFKYDQVKQGMRQVGSTAKPFIYSVAIDYGMSPCMVIPNIPVTFDHGYTPASGDTRPGELTLRQALGWSQNWITAAVLKEVGVPAVVYQIKKMGVSSHIDPYPSVFLGPFDASVYDMTGAYAAFANHGLWTEPTYLLRIEDRNGKIIYENKPKVIQALNEQTAYVMTYMLKGVIEDGTGTRLKYKYGLTNPIGGKTGTTQNNSDGWFIGITPQLVTGVWTGCEDRDIHFRSTALGEGANSALPVFALYMKRVYANTDLGIKKDIDFELPKKPLTIILDCNAYKQQQPGRTETDRKLGFN